MSVLSSSSLLLPLALGSNQSSPSVPPPPATIRDDNDGMLLLPATSVSSSSPSSAHAASSSSHSSLSPPPTASTGGLHYQPEEDGHQHQHHQLIAMGQHQSPLQRDLPLPIEHHHHTQSTPFNSQPSSTYASPTSTTASPTSRSTSPPTSNSYNPTDPTDTSMMIITSLQNLQNSAVSPPSSSSSPSPPISSLDASRPDLVASRPDLVDHQVVDDGMMHFQSLSGDMQSQPQQPQQPQQQEQELQGGHHQSDHHHIILHHHHQSGSPNGNNNEGFGQQGFSSSVLPPPPPESPMYNADGLPTNSSPQEPKYSHLLKYGDSNSNSNRNNGGIFSSFADHQVSDSPQFKCPECGEQLQTRTQFNAHINQHRGIKPYQCQMCTKRYTSIGNLNVHMRHHTGEMPFQCHTCGKRFRNSGTLVRHHRTHTKEKPFECQLCRPVRAFSTKTGLKGHMRTHKTGIERKPFQCEYCQKRFAAKNSLQLHVNVQHLGIIREKNCVCPICGKKFAFPSNLKIHHRSHTHEKPYACPHAGCGKKYALKMTLVAHLRVHTGERPFVCNQQGCSMAFTRKDGLKRHIMSHNRKNERMLRQKGVAFYEDKDDQLAEMKRKLNIMQNKMDRMRNGDIVVPLPSPPVIIGSNGIMTTHAVIPMHSLQQRQQQQQQQHHQLAQSITTPVVNRHSTPMVQNPVYTKRCQVQERRLNLMKDRIQKLDAVIKQEKPEGAERRVIPLGADLSGYALPPPSVDSNVNDTLEPPQVGQQQQQQQLQLQPQNDVTSSNNCYSPDVSPISMPMDITFPSYPNVSTNSGLTNGVLSYTAGGGDQNSHPLPFGSFGNSNGGPELPAASSCDGGSDILPNSASALNHSPQQSQHVSSTSSSSSSSSSLPGLEHINIPPPPFNSFPSYATEMSCGPVGNIQIPQLPESSSQQLMNAEIQQQQKHEDSIGIHQTAMEMSDIHQRHQPFSSGQQIGNACGQLAQSDEFYGQHDGMMLQTDHQMIQHSNHELNQLQPPLPLQLPHHQIQHQPLAMSGQSNPIHSAIAVDVNGHGGLPGGGSGPVDGLHGA